MMIHSFASFIDEIMAISMRIRNTKKTNFEMKIPVKITLLLMQNDSTSAYGNQFTSMTNSLS